MANILIIDDDPGVCQVLSQAVEQAGYEAIAASSLGQGRQKTENRDIDAVFLDLSLPDGDGLKWLSWFQELPALPEVIIITGKGEPAGAELALSRGAFDFLPKPVSLQEVTLTLVRALEYREAKLKRSREQPLHCPEILGQSPAMAKCLQDLAQAAASENSVLIWGETGTGKELFARAMHRNSSRSGKEFVVVDCSALAPNLLESTLFGHLKGAFTGASGERQGLVAKAHKGTLFLDEIGELTLEMQKRFLRVLEEKQYSPLGGSTELQSDFRLICATNRDLEALVQEGQFRADLLHRIRLHHMHLPPLRDRKQDIPLLCSYFLQRIAEQRCQPVKDVYPEVQEIFAAYHWPGNVRELNHALEEAVSAAAQEPALHRKHLPLHLRISLLKSSLAENKDDGELLHPQASPLNQELIPDWKSFKAQVLQAAEQRYFLDLHAHAQGRVKEMARLAGLTQARVYELLKRYKPRGTDGLSR
ncbi:MAG: sigma-54-dependent transcriptional regulator [Desulfohalobiaceae bacterium]